MIGMEFVSFPRKAELWGLESKYGGSSKHQPDPIDALYFLSKAHYWIMIFGTFL